MPGFLADALTRDNNYPYTVAVETAMKMNMPPTVMLLPERQPDEGWTEIDKKLAMAWTILQRETCKECGQPMWICRSSERNLLFSVRTDVCYATAELEKWQDSNKAKKLKKGEKPYVVAKMLHDDEQKPSRMEYIMAHAED